MTECRKMHGWIDGEPAPNGFLGAIVQKSLVKNFFTIRNIYLSITTLQSQSDM